MRKILPFILFLFSSAAAIAGNDQVPIGARAAGLANASVTLSDVWSMNNNIAGIAGLEKTEIGVFAENRFTMKAFTTVALEAVKPLGKVGAVGVELYRFGDELYNEQRIGLGYAHKLGMVSLGLKANLMQVHVEELGSKRMVALSFGGQSEVVPGLVVAGHVYNFNQARIAEAQDERIPTVMAAGISYRPGDKVMLNVETEKDIELPANFKAGIEYRIIEKLHIRAGFATLTNSAAAGVGFKARAFLIDYAFNAQSKLGMSNHVSVSYKFE